MQRRRRSGWFALAASAVMLLAALSGILLPARPSRAAGGFDLGAANRRAPIAGLPDWSKAGYRGGADLPGSGAIGNTISATAFGVVADDGLDDSAALQAAIDSVLIYGVNP